MEKGIKIRSSSSDEIYKVVFKIENDLISINCNCNAGLAKMICKHRLNLLEGDITAVVDNADIAIITDILNEIDKAKIANLFIELNKIEQEIKKLEALRKKEKKEISLKFSNGF
jgi:hypothetical protein